MCIEDYGSQLCLCVCVSVTGLAIFTQRRCDRVKESRLITTLTSLLDISVHFIWSFMQCKVKVHDVLLKLPYRACFTDGTSAI